MAHLIILRLIKRFIVLHFPSAFINIYYKIYQSCNKNYFKTERNQIYPSDRKIKKKKKKLRFKSLKFPIPRDCEDFNRLEAMTKRATRLRMQYRVANKMICMLLPSSKHVLTCHFLNSVWIMYVVFHSRTHAVYYFTEKFRYVTAYEKILLIFLGK